MSGGAACSCDAGKEKPVALRPWEVLTYKGNNSAFNGYRFESSEYSAMHCTACGAVWRTKAGYVPLFFRASVPAGTSKTVT